MPEGDTVYRVARRLRGALAERVLTTADIRVPAHATADLTGRRVLDVVPRGKHLLLRLEDGLTLHTHLRMDGSFRLYRPATPWSGGPEHQIRVVLGNAQWTAVGYRLGVLDLLPTAAESTVVGHLGPDILGPPEELEGVLAALVARPELAIGEALLDQRLVAGIGNVYRTETLFLRGVDPWIPTGEVNDLAAAIRLCRRLMLANLERPEQTSTGSLRRGETHYVYGRGGRPCRRCGTKIRQAQQGPPTRSRITSWCPSCQPGPGPVG